MNKNKVPGQAPIDKGTVKNSKHDSERKFYCSKCKKTITQKVASFCWQNKKRFGGKAFCYDCQKEIPNKTPESSSQSSRH
jgi:predicted amidophosphoribosyltransferase